MGVKSFYRAYPTATAAEIIKSTEVPFKRGHNYLSGLVPMKVNIINRPTSVDNGGRGAPDGMYVLYRLPQLSTSEVVGVETAIDQSFGASILSIQSTVGSVTNSNGTNSSSNESLMRERNNTNGLTTEVVGVETAIDQSFGASILSIQSTVGSVTNSNGTNSSSNESLMRERDNTNGLARMDRIRLPPVAKFKQIRTHDKNGAVVKTPVYVYLKKVVELMSEKHPHSTVATEWKAFLEMFPSRDAVEYIMKPGNTYKIPFEEFWQGTHPSLLNRTDNEQSIGPYDELRDDGLSQPLRGGLVANTTACVEWGPNGTGFRQQPVQRCDEPRSIINWREMDLAGPHLQPGSADISSGVRYEAMTQKQLLALCKLRNLRQGGAKTVAELVALLKANDDTGEGERDAYDKLKKAQLKDLCQSRGLPCNSSMTVDQLRQSLKKQDEEVGEGVEISPENSENDDDDEYENMTKEQLRDRCKNRKLHYSGNAKTLRKRLRDKDADDRACIGNRTGQGISVSDSSSSHNNGAAGASADSTGGGGGSSSSSSSSSSRSLATLQEQIMSEEDAADARPETDIEREVVLDPDDDSTYSPLGLGDCNLHRYREVMREDLNEGGFDDEQADSDNDDYSCDDDLG